MPRISGNLYNCALNCALPYLLEQIQLIAAGNEQLPYQGAYELLKTKFENWYGVRQISWGNLNELLNHKLSFNEVELVLAPVLRLFIAEKASPGINLRNLRDIIEYEEQGIAPELREYVPKNLPGRYLSLTSYEANDLFYQYFGLQMVISEFNDEQKSYVLEIPQQIDGLHRIHAFLKLSHFELGPHESLETEAYRNQDIFTIKERISSDASAFNTNRALADLIPLVSRYIQEIEDTQIIEIRHQLLTPQEYIKHVEHCMLHDDSIEGKLTYAVILLTLMQNFEETKKYADLNLSTPYNLKQGQEIESLLAETKAQATKSLTMLSSKSKVELAPEMKSLVPSTKFLENDPGAKEQIVDANEKTIQIDDFNNILANYKTSYWFLNLLIQLISFGYYKHESNTIKALKTLSDQKEPISNKMIQNVLEQDNHDSQHARRLTFWTGGYPSISLSGTDRVLSDLKKKFT